MDHPTEILASLFALLCLPGFGERVGVDLAVTLLRSCDKIIVLSFGLL